jgi:hypothetical protein
MHADAQIDEERPMRTIPQAKQVVQKAMPPVPAGWKIERESMSEPVIRVAGEDRKSTHLSYMVVYRRVDGVKEERKRLDDAYGESFRKHRAATKPQIDELIKSQTEISLAYRKATRKRNQAAEKRLDEELEENGRTMRAIHLEADRKIMLDMEPYLVRDAEASIRINVNEENAELPRGEPVQISSASFAVRREGERIGITGWKEGQTLILFGDWHQTGTNAFSARPQSASGEAPARTIAMTLTGDKKRTDELLKQIDIRALLALLK